MTTNQAREALVQAASLEAAGRRSTRWMIGWYLAFGAASLAFSLLMAFGGQVGMMVGVGLWAAAIAVLSGWAATRRTSFRGTGRTHGIVMVTWTLAWGAGVAAGSMFHPIGYLAGGLGCLTAAVTGAVLVHQRTR